jgi:phosphopantetheine adenylyltransferase
MKSTTKNAIKQAMLKLEEVIEILEKVKGDNEQIDDTTDAIGFCLADLEYEIK